ncbi:MAG: AAA family ATPase [Ilumatobacter sp.]|nr:AAA family ATPase [Ilumatobacter sp.]
MSSGRTDPEILAAERAINEQYRTKVGQELSETARAVAEVTSLSRNSIWATGTITSGDARGEIAPVVGRVALDGTEEVVAGELYIGPRILELGTAVTVVSWAAPVAQLFYNGRQCDDPAASTVLGRRTFTARGIDLEAFVDDIEAGVDESTVFRIDRKSVIEIPEAPQSVSRPRSAPESDATTGGRSRRASRPTSKPTRPPRPQKPADTASADELVVAPTPPTPTPGKPPVEALPPVAQTAASVEEIEAGHGLRAEAAVLDIVQRPRTGQLTSVLATLQPDQYELVTWPADRPLIVNGQPGTGKTVVAMHRAGFLTHRDRPGGPLDRVVVVGPTDEYRDHVKLVSKSVGGTTVPVHGLPSFLAGIARVNIGNVAPGPSDRIGVQWALWSVVHNAARAAGVAGSGEMDDYRALVKALVTDSDIHQKNVHDAELSAWLKRIGSFEKAASHHNYLPFLASTAVAVMQYGSERVDHMIVDEAQDVPPLVWHLLISFVRRDGSVSLFGDMNQRRSDWTADSWEQLAVDLELTDDDGIVPLRTLETGYRTTRQILKFASQLLPRSERTIHAIREGVKPEVRRVGAGRLISEVLTSADALSQRHATGLTAVISREPRPISDAFRRAGWSRGESRDSWKLGDRTIFVFHPDRARGLEFDGVVVVEPDSFPHNVGRDGVLYTSLTRATQELSVVYSGKLPKNLRRPR